MIRKYSARLLSGVPQVSQSVTPAKRRVPRPNPAKIRRTLLGLRNLQAVQAQSAIRTIPSLHRTANAAPARIPAERAGPGRSVGSLAKEKAASSIAVEIG